MHQNDKMLAMLGQQQQQQQPAPKRSRSSRKEPLFKQQGTFQARNRKGKLTPTIKSTPNFASLRRCGLRILIPFVRACFV